MIAALLRAWVWLRARPAVVLSALGAALGGIVYLRGRRDGEAAVAETIGERARDNRRAAQKQADETKRGAATEAAQKIEAAKKRERIAIANPPTTAAESKEQAEARLARVRLMKDRL